MTSVMYQPETLEGIKALGYAGLSQFIQKAYERWKAQEEYMVTLKDATEMVKESRKVDVMAVTRVQALVKSHNAAVQTYADAETLERSPRLVTQYFMAVMARDDIKATDILREIDKRCGK